MPRTTLPTVQKEQRGTLRPCRVNPDEPQVERGIPPTPEHLSPRAKAAFERYARTMDAMGYLTVADGPVLEQLAQAYTDWREAVEFLDKNGTTYIVTKSAPDGTTFEDFKQFPQVSQRNDADKRLRMLMKDCGLTPSDRSKVSAKGKKTEDPWAGLSEQ